MRPPALAVGDVHQPLRRFAEVLLGEAAGRRAGRRSCASKPAEIRMRSGPKSHSRGRMRSATPPAKSSPVAPAISGALTIVLMLAASRSAAGARIEGRLMRRAEQHRFIRPENILRAIAVMDVEIDDGDALGAMGGLRVARRDRDIVEEAEAHRISRRRRDGRAGATRDEGGVGRRRVITSSTAATPPPAARQTPRASSGTSSCRCRARLAFCGGGASIGRRDIALRMHAQQRLGVDAGALMTRAASGSVPARALRSIARSRSGRSGWPGAHLMREAALMCDEEGSHQRRRRLGFGECRPAIADSARNVPKPLMKI